ncbi:MAG: hypothetical protein HY317_01480 [Acidobacteria bacterium]|nr:hypothetical protein [Acidobacteriota bacterium]
MSRAMSLLLVVLLVGSNGSLAQSASVDPEIVKGMKQVDEGDYDAAILTLDAAARRLAPDPAKTKDLSQAYLYLGIAYVGKGHEAAAKAKFREALTQIKDLSLSPDKFPPKVIDVFEAAKQEAAKSPAPKAAEKKGGGKKGLLIGGVVVAAGAGVAVAAGGGGGSDAPTDTRTAQSFTGTLTQYDCRDYRFVPTKAGTLDASVTWTDQAAVAQLSMSLYEEMSGNEIAKSNPASNTEARLSSPVTNQIYQLYVCQNGYEQPISYTLTVRFP